VTGSSGWLAQDLVPRLKRAEHTVIGLDPVPGPHTDVVGTVADRDLVRQIIRDHRIQGIVHAGALHKPDIVRYPESAFRATNVEGTRNLLDAAVRAGHDRFLFTSTTSLMITAAIRAGRDGGATEAAWLDEDFGPLQPRNIYGVTKLEAERLCRRVHEESGMAIAVLRTGRFFPEDDDTHRHPSGPNIKANELLHRRLTVEDAAEAHVAALEKAPVLGCETFILSAPPPFAREECGELLHDARTVIARHFPDALALYERMGWTLPASLDRVYDPSRAERLLGFRCRTDFAAVLDAIRRGDELPFAHDPAYVSPKEPVSG
jgi:nucleoside-diphosphate-sugar epimerase